MHFGLENYRAMAEGFCMTIYDFYEPEQTKVSQAISDLDQNILNNEKQDDDSGGDDSDYSNEDMKNDKNK